MEYAAKFISTRAKKKASALRELSLLSKLDHERVLYFHDAFEKKNAVIIITEMYPYYAAKAHSSRLQSTQLALESKCNDMNIKCLLIRSSCTVAVHILLL